MSTYENDPVARDDELVDAVISGAVGPDDEDPTLAGLAALRAECLDRQAALDLRPLSVGGGHSAAAASFGARSVRPSRRRGGHRRRSRRATVVAVAAG